MNGYLRCKGQFGYMHIALLYFDTLLGPDLFHSAPEGLSDRIILAVKKLMDASAKGELYEYALLAEHVKIIHHPFEIPSPWARGQVESLMIAVIVEENLKADLFKDVLLSFAKNIIANPDSFMAFYPRKIEEDPKVQKMNSDVKTLLANTLAEAKQAVENANVGNILILGLNKAGKTTLLERVRTKAFNPGTKPTLATNVLEVVLGNYKMNTIDVSGQKTLRSKWWAYTKKPDAVVYIVDLADTPERLQETRKEFEGVMAHFAPGAPDQIPAHTPVLICGNKADLVKNPSLDSVATLLNPEKYGIKYQIQLTSAKTGAGILEGFKWIVQEFLTIG